MSDELKRLREVCEAATPGPWRAVGTGTPEGDLGEVATNWPRGSHGRMVVAHGSAWTGGKEVVDDADARFIALAGSVWPELLAVVEAAREVVETAKPDPETWPARRKLCWMIDDLDAAINRSLDGAS